jgi:plastocyanin
MKLFIFAVLTLLPGVWARAQSEVNGEIQLNGHAAKKSIPPGVYDLRGMTPHEKSEPSKSVNKFERVAVWLEGRSEPAAAITATMRQLNRRFDPELLIVAAGSKVLFPNFDPLFHNIFSLSPVQPFDMGYYAEGKSRELTFSRPGIVQIYCHVHPEMYGVIVVTQSKWTAKPAPDGTFSFASVSPGEYKAVVWQRSSGLIHKNISVPTNGQVRVNFILPDDDMER